MSDPASEVWRASWRRGQPLNLRGSWLWGGGWALQAGPARTEARRLVSGAFREAHGTSVAKASAKCEHADGVARAGQQ